VAHSTRVADRARSVTRCRAQPHARVQRTRVPAERAAAERERAEWLALLRAEGLLPTEHSLEPKEQEIILAIHRLLARTPCRLKLISPYDVLAEPRQPNLPGTIDEHPNWRLPLPATFEELRTDPRVAEITSAFRD
jgi:4-alpha-glucanotransferase